MKKITKFSCISLFAMAVSSPVVFAENSSQQMMQTSFTEQQTKQIESIVHNYLVKNPEVLVEAAKNLQQQQVDKETSRLKSNVQKFNKEVFTPNFPGRLSIGNPNGTIVRTEFFSYQCPNCRIMSKLVDTLVKNNPDLQVILIPWPFENNDDVYAAKSVFAAQKQGKFYELYSAFMNAPDLLTKDSIDKIIKTIPGIDVTKLQKDRDDSSIDESLKENFKLAQSLELNFTPIFIFTNRVKDKFAIVPGRVESSELKKAISQVK